MNLDIPNVPMIVAGAAIGCAYAMLVSAGSRPKLVPFLLFGCGGACIAHLIYTHAFHN